MTAARGTQVDLDSTPYYHCISRCVRRAFLCGEDPLTRKNLDHRKEWVVQRISLLAEHFAINVCAYAVMSNHLHLVLKVDKEASSHWSDKEVISRVSAVYSSVFKQCESWSADKRSEEIRKWRHRLHSLSWFMKALSESIARQANKEDDCKGRFWEGRFKSQALLDEGALLTCMAYVDLNPVRAGVATGLERSDWTSIQQRLREYRRRSQKLGAKPRQRDSRIKRDLPENRGAGPVLARLQNENSALGQRGGLDMTLLDYVGLLEWTGRQVRSDKTGFISEPPTKLLNAAGLNADAWLSSLESFSRFSVLVGSSKNLDVFAPEFGRRWVKGKGLACKMYQVAA